MTKDKKEKERILIFKKKLDRIIRIKKIWLKAEGSRLKGERKKVKGSRIELLNHEKVILTPHTAANTDEAMSRMAVMAAEEILKVLDGEKPLNVINPEIYL